MSRLAVDSEARTRSISGSASLHGILPRRGSFHWSRITVLAANERQLDTLSSLLAHCHCQEGLWVNLVTTHSQDSTCDHPRAGESHLRATRRQSSSGPSCAWHCLACSCRPLRPDCRRARPCISPQSCRKSKRRFDAGTPSCCRPRGSGSDQRRGHRSSTHRALFPRPVRGTRLAERSIRYAAHNRCSLCRPDKSQS